MGMVLNVVSLGLILRSIWCDNGVKGYSDPVGSPVGQSSLGSVPGGVSDVTEVERTPQKMSDGGG